MSDPAGLGASAAPSTSSDESEVHEPRPVTCTWAASPTHPATSVSRPIASVTGEPSGAVAVTVTSSATMSRTPGSVTTSATSPLSSVATTESELFQTVADAIAAAMTTTPSATST